jgi:L-asparaginase
LKRENLIFERNSMDNNQTVALKSDLPELDVRLDALQAIFVNALRGESGYAKLDNNKKSSVDSVMARLSAMRFDDEENFKSVAESLLGAVAPELKNYIGIALNNAKTELPKIQGILVIYTGGTIGSAPKDVNDPGSPQVVKPWRELKNSLPKLSQLNYPIDAISFETPLDSCNVGPQHWRTIAQTIKKYYNDYAGFVVLHGTDSMVYTASALSFMLQDLGKPVIVSGAQVAGVVNARNDAHQNMVTAFMLANPIANRLPLIPEVVVCFGNHILRGCRAKKMHVDSYQGFDTPNYAHLGECGDRIDINRLQVRPKPQVDQLELIEQLDTNVIILEVFPGMQHSQVLGNILKDEHLKGVILKAYGAGNIPTDEPFMNLFKTFIDRGGVVAVTTAVPAGRVEMGLYETSQLLLDRGLIGCFDITPEAALCKLMVLLGRFPDDMPQVKRLMQTSIAGEQSLSMAITSFDSTGDIKTGGTGDIRPAALDTVDDEERIERVILRLVNARFDTGGCERGAMELRLNGSDKVWALTKDRLRSDEVWQKGAIGESLALDLTADKGLFVGKASSSKLGGKQMVSFVLNVIASDAQLQWERAELFVYVRD